MKELKFIEEFYCEHGLVSVDVIMKWLVKAIGEGATHVDCNPDIGYYGEIDGFTMCAHVDDKDSDDWVDLKNAIHTHISSTSNKVIASSAVEINGIMDKMERKTKKK